MKNLGQLNGGLGHNIQGKKLEAVRARIRAAEPGRWPEDFDYKFFQLEPPTSGASPGTPVTDAPVETPLQTPDPAAPPSSEPSNVLADVHSIPETHFDNKQSRTSTDEFARAKQIELTDARDMEKTSLMQLPFRQAVDGVDAGGSADGEQNSEKSMAAKISTATPKTGPVTKEDSGA